MDGGDLSSRHPVWAELENVGFSCMGLTILLSFIECERKKVIYLGKESIIFYILCNFGINLDYT